MKELMKIINGCLTGLGFVIVVVFGIKDYCSKEMFILALVGWVYILINYIALVLPNKEE